MMWTFFYSILTFGLFYLGSGGKCPLTWLERPGGSSCYKLWPNAKKTWDEARATCQLLNADLLKFNSKEEKDWIIEEIMKFPPDLEWWIGLKRDGSNETKWVWTDGETRNDSNKFIQWGSGEPNNHMKTEDCAEIWDNLLNDKYCYIPLQFICEQPIETPRPCDSENGWNDIYPGKNCYKVFEPKYTVSDAGLLCQRNNATILSISDANKQFIFSDYISELNTSVWLNLKAVLSENGRYIWQWMNTLQREDSSQYWVGGQPQTNGIYRNMSFCTTMRPYVSPQTDYQTWHLTGCAEQYSVICEKLPITCPPSYNKFTLFKCQKVDFSESQLPWNEARGYCNLRGTALLEVHSQYEMDELNKLFSSMAVDVEVRSTLRLWLGLTVNGPDKVWDSGQSVGDLVNRWLEVGGATNNTIGCAYLQFTDCLGMDENCDGNKLEWKVGDCNEYRVVSCTVPGDTDVITPSRLKPRYICSDQYEVVDNTCVRRHYGDDMDWFSAQQLCRRDGADLATVHSTKKIKFLTDRAVSTTWIGLNDLQEEGKFYWSNGITEYAGDMDNLLVTNNYNIGNQYSENCIAMVKGGMNGTWQDMPCSFKNSFFCQVWAEWNIAFGKNTRQSSNYGDAEIAAYESDRAIDGCTKHAFKDKCCSHTLADSTPWWELDLGTIYPIRKVIIYRRSEESCVVCRDRMHNFRLFISNSSNTEVNPVYQDKRAEPPAQIILVFPEIIYGRFVRIDVPNSNNYLTLCEVEVFSEDLNRPKNEAVLTEKNSNCYMNSRKWSGTIRHGMSGRLCQEWVLNTPHEHTRHTDSAFPDGSQKAARNYCRDPDGEGRPWCYTVDPNVRWEYCPIPHCNTIVDASKPQEKPDIVRQVSQEELVEDCGNFGWVEDGTGICYRIHGRYTAADAETYCQAIGGHLAVPESAEDQAFLVDLISNLTIDSLVWLGLTYSPVLDEWQTVDQSAINLSYVNSMVNKNDMATKVPSGTGCIGINHGNKQVNAKWEIDNCLNRHHFICRKKAKYVKFFTPNSDELQIQDSKSRNVEDKSALWFEFKGKSGAKIVMKNTKVKSQIPLEINMGFDQNSVSKIVTRFQSVNGFPAPISDVKYSKFWISWLQGRIQVGEGDKIGDNVFLTGSLPGFAGFDYMSISVTGQDVGYWKFPREATARSGRRNLALKKPTWQSSTYSGFSTSDKAVDGCTKNEYTSRCCIHSGEEWRPWWEVDLGAVYNIGEIVMTKRWDCGKICRNRMSRFYVHINDTKISNSLITDDTILYSRNDQEALPVITLKTPGARGRFVLIQIPGKGIVEFCELEIYEDTDAVFCKRGWLSYDDHTCFYFGTNKLSWNDARSQCKSQDPESDLAVISSPQQEMFIFETATKLLPPSEYYRLWFGLKDMTNDAVSWVDKTSTNYSRPSSKNQMVRDQCYITPYNDPDFDGWVAASCALPHYYVCSRTKVTPLTTTQVTTISTTTQTTTKEPPKQLSTAPPVKTTVQPKSITKKMTPALDEGQCKDEWTYNPTTASCVYINATTGVDFFAAELECLKMQSRLASITSEEEERFYFGHLLEYIKKKGKFTGDWDGLWIGGLDLETEGTWKWFLYDEPWFDIEWSNGQPDDHRGKEDCAMTRTNLVFLGEGNDAPCRLDSAKGYICKKYLSESSCEDGWFYDARTGNCYLVQSEVMPWSQAQYTCTKTYGAQLASIVSQKEQEFISVIVSVHKEDPQMFWVGARTDPQDDTWWWADHSTWWMRIAWAEKFEVHPNKQCGAVLGTKNIEDKSFLTNQNCGEKLPFICKKKAFGLGVAPPTDPPRQKIKTTMKVTTTMKSTVITNSTAQAQANKQCGDGWEKRPNSRYCYKFDVTLQTWLQAKEKCNQAGGTLLSITSDEEQHYISGRLTGMRELPFRMWMGATDRDQEGKWTWTDGSPFKFFNWKPTEPNNFEDKEDCGAVITAKTLSYGENFGLWNDINCEVPEGYICKKEASQISTVSPVTVKTTVQPGVQYGCAGKGWLDYGTGSCYLLVQDSVSWAAASTECRLNGGDLASISSEQEQEFIFSQLPQDTYCFNIWENDTECALWAKRGECTRNPIWMATHCHQACKLCVHHCEDLWVSSEKCLEWANKGECDINPAWMKRNCAASCGICRGAPTRGFWIGMHSNKGSHGYEWIDRTDVAYTNWDYTVKQPRYFRYAAGSCVAMFIQTGTWNDGPCGDSLQGYVCKKAKQAVSTTQLSPHKIGCADENSYGYEAYCYTYVKQQKTFDDAQKYCVDKGGHLVYIRDRYVQSFLSSELVNQLQDYWIGYKFEQKKLKWADNSGPENIQLINFAKTFSFAESGDCCFAMTTYKPVGLWKEHNCTEKLPFICQSPREGFTTPMSTTLTTTQYIPCLPGWKEFRDNCYIFPDDTVTWQAASSACRSIGTELASVGSEAENAFINTNMLEVTWLGLHDIDYEGTFGWTDAMPLIYVNWKEGEPNNAGNEDCVTMTWDTKWNDLPCDQEEHYVCKIPKGKQHLVVTSTTPSTTTTEQNLCGVGSEWKHFEGNCYDVFGRASWHEAKQLCLDQGGNLVSIHSEGEQTFVNGMIRDKDDVVWIGFNDLNIDGIYQWNDGSATDYTKWYPGQPNDGGGGEKCVALYPNHNGQWHDYPCRDDKYVMCKRPAGTPVTQVIPTTPMPGGCLPEFKEFGNKCYFVGGLDGLSSQNWNDAKRSCGNKRSTLTSIHSPAENAFVTALLNGANVRGVWIGFNDLMKRNGQFDWADNSVVDFSNWAENQPSSNVYYYYDKELCVELYAEEGKVGQWNDAQCSSRKGYICSAYKNPTLPSVQPNNCPSGYKAYQDHCYKLLSEASSWDACQSQCSKDGGYLVAIGNVYERAFIESFWDESSGPLWVGMKLHKFGEDRWANGEPQTLSDLGNVLSNTSVGCISLEGYGWNIDNCDRSHVGLCEVNTALTTRRTTVAEEKICSNKDLFLFNGYCYYISTLPSSFETALGICKRRKMSFVSIHSYQENNALAKRINETVSKSRSNLQLFFIGMYYENRRDQIPKWVDHTPVNYLRVQSIFYELQRSANDDIMCFAFDTKSQDWTWNVANCKQPSGFVCKMKADAPQTTVKTTTSTSTTTTTMTTTPTTTTTTTATTTTPTTSTSVTTITTPRKAPFKKPQSSYVVGRKDDRGLSPGQIAAIVVGSIAFILTVLVLGYLIRSGYLRRYFYKVENNTSLGFDNALFHKGVETQSESVNFD